jgi:hypothetical protein
MLRGVMGDTAFFLGLRDYYAQNKDGVVDTPLFQAVMEGRYGASLQWYFDEWVYGENSPVYEYGWTSADRGDGTFRTYLRIRQTQTDAGVFSMPVQVTLVSGSGGNVRTVWNSAADEWFALDTTEPVTGLVFDERDWILKAGETEAAPADADADGVPDPLDNCRLDGNGAQADFDLDDSGDACDLDDDGDGALDAADCAPFDAAQGTPAEIAGLAVARLAGGTARLTWTPTPLADAYSVQRGGVSVLGSGDFGSCVATGLAAPQWDDPDAPPAGDGWQYLAVAHDAGCGGSGTAGAGSDGAPRPTACP